MPLNTISLIAILHKYFLNAENANQYGIEVSMRRALNESNSEGYRDKGAQGGMRVSKSFKGKYLRF